MRGGAAKSARYAHNVEVPGANPGPATNFKMKVKTVLTALMLLIGGNVFAIPPMEEYGVTMSWYDAQSNLISKYVLYQWIPTNDNPKFQCYTTSLQSIRVMPLTMKGTNAFKVVAIGKNGKYSLPSSTIFYITPVVYKQTNSSSDNR